MGKRKRVKWSESGGAAQNAGRRLPALVGDYFARGREIVGSEINASELHGLRLLTKRLRYTLELFRPCYGPGFRARLAALRQLQQSLGEISDCVAAAAVLAKCAGKNSAQRVRLDRVLAERSRAQAMEFSRFWREVFDAPGQEGWWVGYLARNALQPGRKR